MKKKYIPFVVMLAAGLQLISACSTGFLDVKPRGLDLESNYYRNEEEAFKGLIAAYDVVGWQGGGYVTRVGAFNAASDDHVAGGGNSTDINSFQVFSNYTLTSEVGPHNELWRKGFSGVFRSNVILAKLPDVPMDENRKKRFIAEARFLRAYFYFDLVRMFKNVPLFSLPVSTSEMYDVLQAPPADVYKQIEDDLKAAIEEPNLPDQVPIASEGGRATKGAVHALLGKVYLYQEKWALAAAEFAEVNGATPGQVNAKYGYRLLADFGDLWKSDNASKFNSESIFEIAFTSTSAGTWDCVACTEGNVLNIMVGPRGYKALTADAPDYVSGWSFLPVTQSLFDAIHFDPRYRYTVANLDSLEENGIAEYEKGYMNTGYFLEKLAGRVSNRTTGGGSQELNYPQNLYEIRLADTYLMEAEALVRNGESGGTGTRSYNLLNAVRARVGLTPVPATIDNIFRERRLELAGEGHRWFDLVRSGQAAAILGPRGFVPGRHEILPIPLLELENTKLEQSKEWGGTK
ncbi:RagB/SusD family nutrient uptake outer membrane protein [Chitinophaga sp. XS-30]|uniref:RagB/SusD family nutrient uptake outer membrane protein n=1 Tax=Chitinophaga sp. XS-30 TaxID=2604421 RepID=UPI0011DE129F|nr:RagB/SusD family nutrient uptake outer membrane protein [Chitinophaga sp. XS-30]QEH42217.1 RagB/SusD family nutrient uptake outer membrane protein [Chitinophaga sp. XS-30]